jgi:hypothetical protein
MKSSTILFGLSSLAMIGVLLHDENTALIAIEAISVSQVVLLASAFIVKAIEDTNSL